MHWKHKSGLEHFARASALTFSFQRSVSEKTWKIFVRNGWIEPTEDSQEEWRQRPYRITDSGRAALAKALCAR